MYAAAVSSGISPFDPRCAILYGREVCKGFLIPLLILLGRGYIGLAVAVDTSVSDRKMIRTEPAFAIAPSNLSILLNQERGKSQKKNKVQVCLCSTLYREQTAEPDYRILIYKLL